MLLKPTIFVIVLIQSYNIKIRSENRESRGNIGK